MSKKKITKLFCTIVALILAVTLAFFVGREYALNNAEPVKPQATVPAATVEEAEAATEATEAIEAEPTEVVEETVAIPEPILWDETVSLERTYHEFDEDMMAYALYTPTNIQEGQKLPLLIWFHGSGEKDVSETKFFDAGLPKVLACMDVTPNAFILCPQLKGVGYNPGQWCDENVLVNVQDLVGYVIETNPAIDTDNISISGHSLGGAGALYMTHHMPNVKRVASLSPYDTYVDTLRMDVEDVKMFIGITDAGEDSYSVRMAHNLRNQYGYDIVQSYSSHGGLPYDVFMKAEENEYSDVFTWLLTK